MKTKSFLLRLLFIVAFSTEDCITDAWTPSSSTAIDLATLKIRRGCRRRSRFAWDFPPASAVRQRQNKNHGSERRSDASCSFLHGINNDDDGTSSYLEEEEFYKEYEDMYSPNAVDNDDNENSDGNNSDTEKLQFRQQQQQQHEQDGVPRRSTMASNNRKVELAEAWDEALIQRNAGASDQTDSDNDGKPTIYNLSDLQQKLQQIQKRNKAGPIGGYSSEKRDNDKDNVLSSELEDKTLDARGQQREVAKDFKSSDRYLDILQKAQERLSEMTDSNDDSSINNIEYKKTKVSNMSSLQERLNQIQRDASATSNSDIEPSSSDLSPPSEQPLKAKYLDDETLAEWEDLDNQLQKEAVKKASKKQSTPPLIMEEPNKEVPLADETAILDALRSQAAFAAVNNSNKNDMAIDSRSSSSSDRTNNLDDRDDSPTPNAIPSNNKKFVLDYEFTDDGGVFLSPEAYQEACNNANPDGSLNFGSDEQEQSSSLESALVDDEPPMAPYGGDDISRKVVSITDLTEEANRSLEFARNNPDAQEELHRRLMAEFEAEEPTNDEFENDALLDPEKVIAFWNQEHFEKQKEEVTALEELLDQKMRALKEEEEDRKNESSNINSRRNHNSNEGQPGRRLEAQKNLYRDDKNIFFASRKERIDSRRMIESNRKERAKNIAKFYKESAENSSWDSTTESKQVEEITKRQEISESKQVEEITKRQEISESKQVEEITKRQEISQKGITDSRKDEKSKEKLSTTKIQENMQSTIPNNDNQKVFPDTNEQRKDKSEWVLVEDPESLEDAFYWNDETSEMRWDPPEEW
jgi:hypothetical protein